MASYWLAISLESSYFCEFRLHSKFQLAWLCRRWISENLILVPEQTVTRNLTAVVALAPAEIQIKLNSAGKLGLEIDAGSSS